MVKNQGARPKHRLVMFALIVVVFALSSACSGVLVQKQAMPNPVKGAKPSPPPAEKIKILHVMSYNADWQWNRDHNSMVLKKLYRI